MALTQLQIEAIRDEVGDVPPDAELQEVYGRMGTVGGTIYSVLARRLANLRAAPASFTVPGEYSQSTQANIAALEKQLERWAAFAPDEGGAGQDTLSLLQLVPRRGRRPRRDPRQALDTEV